MERWKVGDEEQISSSQAQINNGMYLTTDDGAGDRTKGEEGRKFAVLWFEHRSVIGVTHKVREDDEKVTVERYYSSAGLHCLIERRQAGRKETGEEHKKRTTIKVQLKEKEVL